MDYLSRINRDFQGPGEGYGSGAIAPIAGAILNPLAGLYDSHQNRKTSRENTDKTIAAQKAEAELAYQRQVEMWHMQNAFNSPVEQMKRFGAAGLNPNLIYGQGSAGNSSGTPAYQPANIQYRYAAPAYGAAVGTALPTLMSIGTWMQNMRASEVEIQSKETNIQKAEQLIAFLEQKNPREIGRLDNLLSLYPYQKSAADYGSQRLAWQVNDAIRAYSWKYGSGGPPDVPDGGTAALDYRKKKADAEVKELQSEYYEPALFMKMIMGAVAGLGLGRMLSATGKASTGPINRSAKRVKTFYQDGKRRSQVVDY